MADTVNYGLTKPINAGSNGAWGTILNALFDALDALLYPLLGKLTEQMYVHSAGGSGLNWTFGSEASGPFNAGYFHLPLPDVRKGMRITGFSSFGASSAATVTGTVKLAYVDNTGAETIVSTGHTMPNNGSEAETTTSGLTHDVAANRSYYIRVEPSGSIGSVNFRHAKLAVSASP